MSQRTRTISAAAIGVALLLSGCSAGAGTTVGDSTGRSVSSSAQDDDVAVTQAEAQAIMQRYDTANNAAVRGSWAPKYDENPWKTAESGPALATDVFNTRLSKQRHDRAKPRTFTHDVVEAYGSTKRGSDGQPPWLLVTGIVPAVGNTATPHDFAAVMVKEPSGWRLWAELTGDLRTLPSPPKKVPPLTPAQQKSAVSSVVALSRAVSTGVVDDLEGGVAITEFRSALASALPHTEMTIKPRPWGTPAGTSAATAVGTPAVRLMPVGSMTLGLVSFENDVTYDARGTSVVIKIDPDYAAVEGISARPTAEAHRRTYQTMLVGISDSGATTIFGSNDGLLAKAGS